MGFRARMFYFISVLLGGNLFAEGNYYADANREIFLFPKSAAMGGADLAFDRSASPLSNAAALPNDSAKMVSVAYAGYFQNTYSTGAVSYVGPIDRESSIGISASYVFIPGIEIHDGTTVPQNVPVKTSSDLFLRISYGRRLLQFNNLLWSGDRILLTAGAAVNARRRNLVGWTGYGVGADGGLDVSYLSKGDGSSVLTAGMVVENLTTNYTHWSSEYKEYAYPHVRIGLGWQKELAYLYGRLNIAYCTPDLLTNEGINYYAADSLAGHSEIESPAIKRVATHPFMLFLGGCGGAEYTIMNTLSFRSGVNMNDGTVCFGGGLHLFRNRMGFDFAFLDHALASTYKISVNYRWF